MLAGHIEETVRFATEPEARLTYALEHAAADREVSIHYSTQLIRVLLSTEAATRWTNSDDVGIYGHADTGAEPLELIVEKDFACIDAGDADNADAFPNPKTGVTC
jgi:hypothetical protein